MTVAVDNLDQANMVVAISNGNEGPGYFTVGSPGMAARGLTAGASTVPHFVGAPVTVNGNTYGAASGDFAVVSIDTTAPLAVVAGTTNGLDTACGALIAGSPDRKDRADLARRMHVLCKDSQRAGSRGGCRACREQRGGRPDRDGNRRCRDAADDSGLHGLAGYGQALKATDAASTKVGAALSYFSTTNANIMAGFSSQGPTDVDFRVKPDVVAPGVNVLSSVPMHLCGGNPCFAFFSGTSMAAPHLAGSAAVVRGQRPDLSAAEVRSTIVNTAVRGALGRYQDATPVTDVNIIGAGLENLQAAVNAVVALDPVSLAFGGVPSGSGQTRSRSMTITNLSGTEKTFGLAISGQTGGVAYSVSPATVSLDVGASATVTVTARATVGASGPQQAFLEVKQGDISVGHAALFTLMK